MGCRVSIDENVHVVIVAGGFGGIAAAQHLKHHGVPFMLINILDAFHHNIAALRASVQTGFAKQTFIPYKDTFGLNFLQARVIQIDTETQTVVLDNGKQVRYSHLILCTGTSGHFSGKHNCVDTYKSAIQFTNKNVKLCVHTQIDFVILIHPREEVADPDLLPSVKEQAKKVLLEKGVELLLGQKVTNLDELELNVCRKGMLVKTNKNEQVTADLVICCTGNKISSEAYRSTHRFNRLSNSGALKVNKHLQVEGFDSVYAVGDCADLDEPKMAYHAGLHAAVAATNIINSLTGKSLTSYRTGNVTMLIAMGKDAGVGQFNGYKLPRFLVTKGKTQSLLLWKSWREMGQKAPN
uniref:Ferroptosis suppressor protein 1 n=1 Tax=Cyprinus carpio TaxID=7962 RepID=A0A8C2A2R0_CYPCA